MGRCSIFLSRYSLIFFVPLLLAHLLYFLCNPTLSFMPRFSSLDVKDNNPFDLHLPPPRAEDGPPVSNSVPCNASVVHWLTAKSMTSSALSFLGLKGRDPRRQINAERRIAKERRHRSHPATTDMCISRFSARFWANRLSIIEPSGPIPPVVAITNGVKSACSTLRRRSRYSRFFLFSCIVKQLERLLFL